MIHSRTPEKLILKSIWLLLALLITGFFSAVPSEARKPLNAKEHYQKGLRLSQIKDWQDAAAEFQKAIDLDPKYALAHANLGVALSQTGKHKDALLEFDEALRQGYDHAFLRYNRGVSFTRLGLLEEAEAEFLMALKKDSRMSKARYDLGILYLLQSRLEKAREQVNQLYRKNNKLSKKLFEQIPGEYKVAEVNNGGELRGRVTLTGPIPRARSFHLIHAPNIQFCARISDGKGHRILKDFTVSANSGLKDTVIALQGVNKGKPFPTKMQTFNIDRCHSDQYVIGVRNGENILIENKDPIRHEIATYEINKANYVDQRSNKAIIKKSSQIRSAFVRQDTDEFLIKCNLHPFLQTRGFMVENPYYAISDQEGNFSLKDVPPGTYDVLAWHPFIPTQKGTVTIEEGKVSQIDFVFDEADQRRKLYQDDIEGYRFNPWFDSKEKFYGGPRVDDPVEVLQKF
jgi:tetratricopeptide (TPR) repeat protein